MTDLDILLLGVVVTFIAAAGAYVSIRAQFGYRDESDLEPLRSATRLQRQTAHAAAHEIRRVVNG